MNKKVSKFLTSFIIYLSIAFCSVLTLATFFLTTNDGDYGHKNLETSFAPYIAFGIIIFTILLAVRPVRRFFNNINLKFLYKCVFIWGLVMSVSWIFIADVLPMWDSMDLVYAADWINQNTGGVTASWFNNEMAQPIAAGKWSAGSYMERYPYQTPIAMLIFLCMKFAGSNFIVFFEILNCLACAFTMYFIVKYTHELFKNKTATSISALLIMLFAPLILYCTFIYGNVLCLPFAIACLYFEKRGLDLALSKKSSEHKHIIYIAASIICGAISVILKSPMLFFVVAAAVVYVIWAIQHKRYIYFATALASVLIANYAILPINSVVGALTKQNLNNGTPTITWITMGVGGGKEYIADKTENEEERTDIENAGYYDGFPWVLSDSEYSPENMKNISGEYLKKRLEHYANDPGLALSYFGRKLTIEWTEPTFESLLASNWDSANPITGYNMSTRPYTPIAKSVYYGKAHTVLIYLMDCLQTIIPIGVVICFLKLRKKLNITQLGAIIYVLGIFVVYLFWEDKTQYMFPAFIAMIPYAGIGWYFIVEKVLKLLKK